MATEQPLTTEDPSKETQGDAEGESTAELEGGSYDVIRRRLLAQADEIGARAGKLNERRKLVFGGTELSLIATERVRTEHNCVPRDIKAIQGKLLFGYNVFIGLKAETVVRDVFSVHKFEPTAEGFDLSEVPIEPGHYLDEPQFVKEFQDLYKYARDAKLAQLKVSDTRLLAVFHTGATADSVKVFRWRVEKGGKITFMDTRGDEDNAPPRSHNFEWVRAGRENQVTGRFPHISILDEVFVETTGGDLTLKIENNTEEGRGIYSEPVDDQNQTLDDAEIHYAKVGTLILLKIKPYREERYRYFIFNTRLGTILRNDTIGHACLELPEDQGIIFPGGYYLRTGESKMFESDAAAIRYYRTIKSPNGEDVLYIFHRDSDGHYLLLPYNLIRKEVQSPVHCHGYSVFDDGKMVIFRVMTDEPTRVHPMQVWQTPFTTQEFAASAPTDGSYLAKVGNADLVRGISDFLTLRSLAKTENPTRRTYEDVISTATRIVDTYYWVGHAETENIAEVSAELKKTAELIVDEFEKVAAIKKRAAETLVKAQEEQDRLLSGLRPEDMKSVEDFMQSLTKLRHQRGHLITMRDMRYMNLPEVDRLEAQVIEGFDKVSLGCVEFMLGGTALAPLMTRLTELVGKIEVTKKSSELKAMGEDITQVNEGLNVLSEVIAGLAVDDPTKRTQILEQISEVFSQLNRARATLQNKNKELSATEGRAEFHAQFQLFNQSVQSSLAVCNSPEKCDEELSRLLLMLEELEGRFGEFDEFLSPLAEKREELTEALQAKRQTLLDERQRRAANVLGAAERIVNGIERRARTLETNDDLNAYFASDAMVLKCKDLTKQLVELGDTVKADEIDAKLKTAKQNAMRALRDRQDLYEGGEAVIKLGRHRFNVTTQTLELTIVPRDDPGTGKPVLFLHMTGTDFYEPLEDASLEGFRDLWDQQLISETNEVYRSEYLAASLLFAAEAGEEGWTIEKLQHAALGSGGLLEAIRSFSANRHDEGYERGVHDSDAAIILDKLLSLRTTAGLLRFASGQRALACLYWASLEDVDKEILHRRARSMGRLRSHLESSTAQSDLADEIAERIAETARAHRLDPKPNEARIAALYLVEEVAADRPRFKTSGAAAGLKDNLLGDLDRRGARQDFDDDLRTLEAHPAERLELCRAWLEALVERHSDLEKHRHAILEAAVLLSNERALDRETTTAATDGKAEGILGQHPRVTERSLPIRLEEFLGRLDHFIRERAPRFREYRKLRHEVVETNKRRLRIAEFQPRVLSSFVRNRLIDEVYLPIIGDNLAKQMGAAGDTKRTDLMGLLMLISPPGYGKTTLMEYVANALGLIFMKINGPSLGHEVTSLDPEDAPNATARQEVDKLNLALEMGNNVMIYVDDIQHTNPEFLQKFISLCDAQRRIEGVWRGRTRTYDLRGKKVCVVMAGNPYTEVGEKFAIPDMLANRADTYNLGDILEGKADVFALSYIENSLTSNSVLAPLAGREQADTRRLIKMAQGEQVAASELNHAYTAAEVAEITAVLARMFKVQKVILQVNQQYILSASQDDAYRTEPPFKLQGSYRNMNKLAEKVVAAHTDDEIEALLDDHYNGEAQTLTTGSEQNLLKLAEMRGRMSEAQKKRWEEIKSGYTRVKLSGSNQDDPVARVTTTLGGLAEQLHTIGKTLDVATQDARSRAQIEATRQAVEAKKDRLAPLMAKLDEAIQALASPRLSVQVERDPAIAELLAQQLAMVESTILPVAQAVAESAAAVQASVETTLTRQIERESALGEKLSVRSEDTDALRAKLDELAEAQRGAVAQIQQVVHAAAEQAARAAAHESGQARDLTAVQQRMQQTADALAHQVAQAQAQTQQAMQALAQQTAHAQQIAHAQHAAVQQAQHAAAATQQAATEAQKAAIAKQRMVAEAQAQAARPPPAQTPIAAHAFPPPAGSHSGAASHPGVAPVAASRTTVGQMMTGSHYVQRPGASAEENAAIARAQLAAQRAAAQHQHTTEMAQAVYRVEHRIHELSEIIRSLQGRLAEGVSAAAGSPRYDAMIDIQSESNFYCGVAGGHVSRDGGIFVQTHRPLPQKGAPVVLRVSLPGGVGFETTAVVDWVRDTRSNRAPPGFGARFVDLPAHARQLVDQFLKSREPLLFE